VKPLRCLLGRHEWRVSRFRALNALPGEYEVVCQRCGKYEYREAGARKPRSAP